ncbi:hypothetical protein NCS57_00025600 [Fusarium keratoplasticum]|uniref:Uncharacterized protein n=1 Tax=Fusarium keratoplasticum TaxID=1328300 RepID=A0ACC0RFI7_9HYPO|nr:hypothetical protein NCS57_00025600 [Fusarium keratoplasticum]KAI8683609.1 hypothetical protein NCS57_00025600 [Fusarium keratoplasticum]
MKSTSAEYHTPQPGSRLHYELEYEMARLSQTVDPTTVHKATFLSSYSARRDYLERVFSENLKGRTQDVMAIVNFPRRDKFVYMPNAINIHLEEWLALELRDPLEEYLPAELDKAYHFVRLTEQYMEDYLSKALSPDLIHAYLKLPHWCHLSYDEHRTVEVKSQDRVHLNSLSSMERDRLFQAFFHYQLNCLAKPVRPRYWSQTRFPEEQSWWLMPQWGTSYHPSIRDIDATQCVHEYLRTLVGALAARFAGDGFKTLASLFDERREAWSTLEGLVFPDNVQFNPELHMTSPDSSAICTLINCLAASGVNLIDELLRLDMKECKAFFDHLYDEMTIQTPVMAPRSSSHPTIDRYYNPVIPNDGLWAELRFRFHFAQGPEDLKQAYIRMYRQRAWAFFDDDRLFKNGVNLCDFQDFQARASRMDAKEYKSRRSRRQHLSAMKMGQSPSPHHEDLKRGVEYYPTLEKVLFWNEVDNIQHEPVQVVKDELFQVAEGEIISGSDDDEFEQEADGGHINGECPGNGFLDEDLEAIKSKTAQSCCPIRVTEPIRFRI